MLFAAQTSAVFADSGPKPSVTVDFSGLEGVECFSTLLADRENIGPWYVEQEYYDWYANDGITEDMFYKFRECSGDGWYFVGNVFNTTDGAPIRWTYYPPDPFRILIYIPEQDRTIISGSLDRFAFDSYYTATVDVSDGTISVKENHVSWFGAFALRLAVTLAVELLIALAFALRSRKQLGVICVTNIITQIGLNLFLMSSLSANWFGVLIVYPVCEIIVFAVEAAVYTRLLSDGKFGWKRFTLYAFVANAASFLIGFALPQLPWVIGW